MIRNLLGNEDGATMVEYALMLALIGAALLTTLTSLSSAIGGKFNSVASTVTGSSS